MANIKGEDILRPFVRPVTDEDREKLPTFSHSKLECFENCPMQYKLKYLDKKTTSDTTIALEIGTLLHAVLEQKGYMLNDESNDCIVNYDKLLSYLEEGIDEVTDKNSKHIPGLVELKAKYWESWGTPDSVGNTYDTKIQTFKTLLYDEMEDDKWEPYLFEHPFEFVWNDKAIIVGFIDRIDKHGDMFRTVDYKTSKKIYDNSKIATSQQFGIYALAILNEFGKLPDQSMYRFILLDEKQYALTKGWEKRLIKKLDKVFDQIEELEKSQIWTPKASPLCYFCNYAKTNPTAKEYKNECEYYSLWTPSNKSFEKNKVFDARQINDNKRKIVF